MSTSSRSSIKNDVEDSDSSSSRKIDIKKKEPVKRRDSSSSSSEDEKSKIVISNTVVVTETLEKTSDNQKTVHISVVKEENPGLLKTLVTKKDRKPKSSNNRSISLNKSIRESEDESKENKENKVKNSWERSTRIDKKLNDIYYMSALNRKDISIDEKPSIVLKKKPKKTKRKTEDKKLMRSVSAKLISEIKTDNKSSKQRKSSSSSEESESKSKSISSEKKVGDTKRIKNKRNSISSTLSQDSLSRKPPLLFPRGKIEYDGAIKNEQHGVALNSPIQATRTSNRRRTVTREIVECDVYREYRPKLDSHDIAHHFFHRENEQQYFVRALKKDISTYLNAKLREDRFRVMYRDFADKKPKYNFDFEVPLLYKQGINNKRWVTGQRFRPIDISSSQYNRNVDDDDENDQELYLEATGGSVPIEKYFYKKK